MTTPTQPMRPKRYNPTGINPVMEFHVNGAWIKFENYIALESENAELRAQVEKMRLLLIRVPIFHRCGFPNASEFEHCLTCAIDSVLKAPAPETEKCKTCFGTKKTIQTEDLGNGSISIGEVPCPTCKGTGIKPKTEVKP